MTCLSPIIAASLLGAAGLAAAATACGPASAPAQQLACATPDCLQPACAVRNEALRRQAIRCPIDAAGLLGRWERVDGNGLDAVEFLEADGRLAFASHGDGEHERTGTWRLRDCIVDLESDEGRAGLQIQAFDGDTLRVEDLDEHENAVLRRGEPAN